jgi:hypothetical protein
MMASLLITSKKIIVMKKWIWFWVKALRELWYAISCLRLKAWKTQNIANNTIVFEY